MNLASVALIAWLDNLRVGSPRRNGPLSILAVYGDASRPAVAYRTLAEAIEAGEVLISEQTNAR